MAMRMAIKRAIGIVKTIKEGRRKTMIFAITRTPIPLLTIKSMIWSIFPISRTNVRTNRMIKKGKVISLKI